MEKLLEKFGNKYSVSDNGIIYSLKGNKKELKGKIGNSGYREILINHNGIRKYFLVHRLVAINFISNEFNKRTINHIDGNKLNNSVENLEWNTDSENQNHAIEKKLIKHKIDFEIAEKIRNDIGSNRELAIKYNLGKTQIGYIKLNKRWKKST
jgi:hypothetical protein